MSDRRKLTLEEKGKLYLKQRGLVGEKSEMVDRPYQFRELGPHSDNPAGRPKLRFEKTFFFSATVIAAVWYSMAGRVPLDFFGLFEITMDHYNFLTGVMFPLAIGVFIIGMWTTMKLYTTTFKDYVRVLDFILRYMDSRPSIRGELRIKRIPLLWHPEKSKFRNIAERYDVLKEEMNND